MTNGYSYVVVMLVTLLFLLLLMMVEVIGVMLSWGQKVWFEHLKLCSAVCLAMQVVVCRGGERVQGVGWTVSTGVKVFLKL